MTGPRPGDTFDIDLGGTVIAGHYVEVDSPHRLVIGWDHHGTDSAQPTPARVEITLTPNGEGTTVTIQVSGTSTADAVRYRQLWLAHVDRMTAALAGGEPTHSS